MAQRQYSTRLPEDKAEQLEQVCEERDISKAEALRRSVEEYTDSGADPTEPETVWRVVVVMSLVFTLLTVSGAVPDLAAAIVGTVLAVSLPVSYLAWVF